MTPVSYTHLFKCLRVRDNAKRRVDVAYIKISFLPPRRREDGSPFLVPCYCFLSCGLVRGSDAMLCDALLNVGETEDCSC